ncbi:hypothetical protein AKJ16_DCAP24201 [Drosera capensis]
MTKFFMLIALYFNGGVIGHPVWIPWWNAWIVPVCEIDIGRVGCFVIPSIDNWSVLSKGRNLLNFLLGRATSSSECSSSDFVLLDSFAVSFFRDYATFGARFIFSTASFFL